MRLDEIVSVSSWISRKLGNTWGEIGDTVKGTVVSDYLDKNNHFPPYSAAYEKRKYKLVEIDLDTAIKFRRISDTPYSMMDSEKLSRAREYNITYDSLKKNPPVVQKDGTILDGNHRMERAIELRLPKIPILLQIK